MQASDEENHSDSGSQTGSEEETTNGLADPPPIMFIRDKSKRRSIFKRRKDELMKKSYELSTMTGTQALVLAVSENGLVYTFTTTRLQGLVTGQEGKNLIQSCLNGSYPPSTPLPNGETSCGTVQLPTPNSQQPGNRVNGSGQDEDKGMAMMNTSEGHAEAPPKPDPGVKYALKGSVTEKTYVRSERFWLADGNIILSARLDTTPKSAEPRFILYRVHKSALARHSEVFEHMFSSSATQASEGAINEMYEGLPVVDMPDSKEHVCSLLQVLYEPWTSLPFKHFDPRAGDTAKLVLEIASKYEMDAIRKRIIAHIEDYWPRILAEWDIFEARLKIVEADDRRDDEMDCFVQEPATAIALARRFEIKAILPAAFYDLARVPASCDWNDRQMRAEDVVDIVDEDTWNVRSARWTALAVTDYHRVCVGRERLRAKVVSEMDRIFRRGSTKGCFNLSKCRDQCIKVLNDTKEKCYTSYDFLRVLREAGERVAVCHPCREEIRSDLQECRTEIWSDLSKTFALHNIC